MTPSLAVPLAAANNFGDNLAGGVAGPMALLVVVLLGIGTVLLLRNMNTRLRRLPASFDDTDHAKAAGAAASAKSAGDGADPSGRSANSNSRRER